MEYIQYMYMYICTLYVYKSNQIVIVCKYILIKFGKILGFTFLILSILECENMTQIRNPTHQSK